ncbi:MAG TPA: zinc ABC transporter substrate-binding protein, partial [Candidatus Methylacidiphilales bacterium]|nr:zinc ABC transporter substrate-binding protein [Candidatus Methylacidiphilales bacterium]
MKAFIILVSFFACVLAHADTIKIVAAENFYGSIARQIGGDSVSVTSILSNPNQDPHEFTTDAATAKAVADADIVIYSGIGYDDWMDKLLGTAGKKDRVVIRVSDLIGAKDGDNPHIWYDPRTMPALADKLGDEIFSLVNRGRPINEQNPFLVHAINFKNSMKPELEKIAAIKSKYGGTPVTATEPVFGYMLDA